MRRWNLTASLAIGVLVLGALVTGCSAPTRTPPSTATPIPAPTSASPSVTPSAPSADQMIVRNATLDVEVDDVTRAADQIWDIAGRLGGTLVRSDIRTADKSPSGIVAIRVPADRFREALDGIRGLARKVLAENSEAQDVTEEYVDLEAQVKNLASVEQTLQGMLQKAATTDEALKVFDQVKKVQSDIERMKGRMQYLSRTSATSLITTYLRTPQVIEPTPTPTVAPTPTPRPLTVAGWSPTETSRSAVREFIALGSVVVNLVIWLAVFSPIWIIALVITWLTYWRRRAPPRT